MYFYSINKYNRPVNESEAGLSRRHMASMKHAADTAEAAAVNHYQARRKGKGSPYSITEHRVPELIPVLGSQLVSLQVT